MIAIDRIISRLVEDEGEVLHSYKDHLGYDSIGVGRLIDQRKGGGISRDESRYLLANDIRKWMAIAAQWDWFDKLDWQRQGVIVCLLHQLGYSGLSKFKKMLAAIERQDFETAAAELLDSKLGVQTPTRTKRSAEILRTGQWL